MKHAAMVAVGEKHSLALQRWSNAPAAFHSPAVLTQQAETAGQLSPRGSEAESIEVCCDVLCPCFATLILM